ncbi:MAG: TRAP transporter large permease subunit [Magnetococcales bacterium]|nr:TRAP transporter large permease subunit [Magnetococcales bacterium]
MGEYAALWMFLGICAVLAAGYPVAFSLAGTALMFAGLGVWTGDFDPAFLEAVPNRLYGVMNNDTLIAVPLFVFMGVVLEKSRIAESLLETMGLLFGPLRGGLGISVCVVGMLMAASTGIVGATVVTMGLMSLPTMLRRGYDPKVACGVICASGTLGQIIPPSVILVLLGDVISSAYQQAQLSLGSYSPRTVSVGDLFVGALLPGLLLVLLYIAYMVGLAIFQPEKVPALPLEERLAYRGQLGRRVLRALVPPMFLILAVLGSILAGVATPTEAAGMGAAGALLLALLEGQLGLERLREVMRGTAQISSMVFMILLGAAIFSLVFRGFQGDEMVHKMLTGIPGGAVGAMLAVMLLMFILGFFIDFIEIIFVVVPLVGPPLLMLGLDPLWLGVMMAVNLQTSFLTPPFGFTLFYLRGVAHDSVRTSDIYRGVMPFIALQLLGLLILSMWPALVTWLPGVVYGQ